MGGAIAEPGRFAPAEAHGTIRIGSRFAEVTFLPQLLERLGATAPGLSIHVRKLGSGTDNDRVLADGDVDIVVQAQSPDREIGMSKGPGIKVNESHYSQRLWDESWVCLVREGHPTIRRRLSLDRYCSHGHILISLRGDAYGFVDVCRKLGRPAPKREVRSRRR